MSKILVYERLNREVLELDTVTRTVSNLGGVLPSGGVIQNGTLFDARTQNNIVNFRGYVYAVTEATGNFIEVFRLDAGSWVLEHTIFPVGGQQLGLIGVQVNNERMVIAYCEIGFFPLSTYYHTTSTDDGAVWTVSSLGPLTGVWDWTGSCMKHRGAVFIAGGLGICAFRNNLVFANPAPDGGDDSGLASIETEAGCFATWNGDLYFLRPTNAGVPLLYKLDPTWSVGSPPPTPAWTNESSTGLPVMTFSITVGGARPCLFRSLADELVVLQIGGSAVFAKTNVSSYPAFTDITSLLPTVIQGLTNAQVWCFTDDRRRTNPIQYLFVRDGATFTHYLMTWDGVGAVELVETFTGAGAYTIMFPHDQHADLRIHTDRQPQVFFDSNPAVAVVENFPGQYELTYYLVDDLSRTLSILPEYSVDGDEWLPMTEGSGGDGKTALSSSPAGDVHTFVWDAYQDITGVYPNMQMRIVPRITGV